MTSCQKAARPLTRCLQNTQPFYLSARSTRPFSSTSPASAEVEEVKQKSPPVGLDPETVVLPREERKLMRHGIMPVGSRRRRAAIKTSANIPFEQLPYQTFQEARKVLQADRAEKLELIAKERVRIANLVAQDPAVSGGELNKKNRLDSMRRHLEWLKIQADINDPMVKKRFEDGQGMYFFPYNNHVHC
jgi:large subunit ribosomal protein L35